MKYALCVKYTSHLCKLKMYFTCKFIVVRDSKSAEMGMEILFMVYV